MAESSMMHIENIKSTFAFTWKYLSESLRQSVFDFSIRKWIEISEHNRLIRVNSDVRREPESENAWQSQDLHGTRGTTARKQTEENTLKARKLGKISRNRRKSGSFRSEFFKVVFQILFLQILSGGSSDNVQNTIARSAVSYDYMRKCFLFMAQFQRVRS